MDKYTIPFSLFMSLLASDSYLVLVAICVSCFAGGGEGRLDTKVDFTCLFCSVRALRFLM